MSLATKQLPKVPIIIDNSPKLNDKDHEHDVLKPLERNKKPSPLKQQITRSSSLSSNESKKSASSTINSLTVNMNKNGTNGTNGSAYLIQVNKTPINLTPSQRLILRKSQLNDSIGQFKSNDTHIGGSKMNIKHTYNPQDFDFQDEIIDEGIYRNAYMNNSDIPFVQPVLSVNYHDLLFQDPLQQHNISNSNNNIRKFSLTNTDSSTRTSSILSMVDDTGNDTTNSSVVSVNDEYYERPKFYKSSSSLSISQVDFNRISKDAQELTLLFNQNDQVQMFEKSNQMKQMLTNFKKLNSSLPSIHSETINSPPSPSTDVELRRSSLPNSYQSFTRPTYLPPKDINDRIRHQRLSNEMLNKAVMKESDKQIKNLHRLEKIKCQKQQDLKIWNKLVLETDLKGFNARIKSTKHFEDLYWRGLVDQPEDANEDNIRRQVWWKVLNLNYSLNTKENEEFCDYYFDKYETLKLGKLLEIIKQDMATVYSDMLCFQNQDVITKLTRVVVCFSCFLQDKDKQQVKDKQYELIEYYNRGYVTLAASLYYNYKNSYKTLITLRQFHQFSEEVLSNAQFTNKFEDSFNANFHRLRTHFKIIDLNPVEYLPELIKFSLTNLVNFEISQHIIDLIIFEHSSNYENFLIQLVLGLFSQINYKLFGSKEEVLNVLIPQYKDKEKDKYKVKANRNNEMNGYYLNVGHEFDFIDIVRNLKV
ncbi:uncharacterized protein RJT21DRAFT_3491 [Scheffersomyces amazonensis]|uniref:uncharacterized protein n=1 Tax=Scheffersomyces amazonensis TaxID=1078765 RepID=UPI00315D732A